MRERESGTHETQPSGTRSSTVPESRTGWRALIAGFVCAGAISTSAGSTAADTLPGAIALPKQNVSGRSFHSLAAENGQPVPHVCKKIEQGGRLVLRCGPSSDAAGLVHASRIVHPRPRQPAWAHQTPKPRERTRPAIRLPDPTRRLVAAPVVGSFDNPAPPPDVTLMAAITKPVPVVTRPVPPQPAVRTEPRSSYIVATTGAARDVLSTLKSLGDRHYQLLGRGPYMGRVSLGVFGVHANAVRRANALARHGVHADVIERWSQRVISRHPVARY